jgi:polysaccharide pyruvyl transferase WcaK-like protein
VPSIMVEYRPKCRDFMASIELEDYVIKTSDFTEQTFWPLFERLRAESKRVCAQAEERILLYKRLQFAEAQKLEASLIAA